MVKISRDQLLFTSPDTESLTQMLGVLNVYARLNCLVRL